MCSSSLDELRQSVRERTYTPLPVREHAIPKRGSGKVRKLGIPALADRIVQMALVLVPFDSASEASALALRARKLWPAKPARLGQVSGGEVEFFDEVGDGVFESVEVSA